MKRLVFAAPVLFACAVGHAAQASGTESPYAATVVSYDPGSPEPPLTNPDAALGSPTRFTGGDIFPSVVSFFNPPWFDDELVSIGPGGHLTVEFDSPILDDPEHPFGMDLLIFGNTGFIDANFPQGIVGGLFGNDGGMVELSADGEKWTAVPGLTADNLYPTQGYLDSGPYDTKRGQLETDFTRPVDPSLTLDDFLGLSYAEARKLYDNSGGGVAVDIDAAGLSQVLRVRISLAPDAKGSVQVDALAKVSPALVGDLNHDDVVNVSDLLLLLDAWGPVSGGNGAADLDGDGVVNVSDLLILLANWG